VPAARCGHRWRAGAAVACRERWRTRKEQPATGGNGPVSAKNRGTIEVRSETGQASTPPRPTSQVVALKGFTSGRGGGGLGRASRRLPRAVGRDWAGSAATWASRGPACPHRAGVPGRYDWPSPSARSSPRTADRRPPPPARAAGLSSPP
jgi:hypothetical protein